MDLKVMTFNIRNGIADDGTNSWQFRKHLVVRAIRDEMPHVMGLQEVFWDQRKFLWNELPEFEQFGEHREGGRDEEAALICYRHDTFSLLEGGNLWLSDTPTVAGSRSWGNRHTRIAAWALLRERDEGAVFLFINCHLDHEAEEARQRSARLIRDFSLERGRKVTTVLVGDFNAWPDTPAYRILTGDGREGDFADTWRLCDQPPADERTFHGWQERGFVGQRARIDWVLVRPQVKVLSVTRPAYREKDRFPSDHYPVATILRFS